MKTTCGNCNAEWVLPAGKSITACPFCGKPLATSNALGKFKDIADVIRYIIELRGPSVIKEQAFSGLLTDLAQPFERERKWIKYGLAEADIGKAFYQAHMSSNPDDRVSAREVALRRLVMDGATAEKANFIVQCFVHGLGWDSDAGATIANSDKADSQIGESAIKPIESSSVLAPTSSDKTPISEVQDGITVPPESRESIRFKQLLFKAQQGDADSMDQLGAAYCNGSGVEADNEEAFKWFQKAANQGSPLGQFHLGLAYHLELGTPANYSEALRWYSKSADNGIAEAENNIGEMFFQGLGAAVDQAEAVRYYRSAAQKGVVAAQYNLGIALANGFETPRCADEAKMWLTK
ncbi:MAG: sel1 repeat family protein, partial [Clostridiales bacterium]|nr:sel1 repeat family protein [Clostridiales bacterium]